MTGDSALSGCDLVIYVANTVEGTALAFVRQLPAAQRDAYIRKDQFLGERALFWGGDNVLVLTSIPAEPAFCQYVKKIMGYRCLINKSPQIPGISLSEAIMKDSELIKWISDHIKKADRPIILPYAVTEAFTQLCERLKSEQPNLRSPETCSAQTEQLIHRYDSKSGVRQLMLDLDHEVSDLCSMPKGFICASVDDAQRAEQYFSKIGTPFLIKPNLGESGMGILRVDPSDGKLDQSEDPRGDQLLSHWPWKNDIFVLEEEIQNVFESPGVQIEIPPIGGNQVRITYLCRQRLSSEGAFQGIELDPDTRNERYAHIKQISLHIGVYLQNKGYTGRCGLDFIIDRSGSLFFIEANLRRGGGTHVHAISEKCLGSDRSRMVTVSRDNQVLADKNPIEFETFHQLLGPLLFKANSPEAGIVITTCGDLQQSTYSYVAMGSSISQVNALELLLEDRQMLRIG